MGPIVRTSAPAEKRSAAGAGGLADRGADSEGIESWGWWQTLGLDGAGPRSAPLHAAARQPADEPAHLENGDRGENLRSGQPRAVDDGVDGDAGGTAGADAIEHRSLEPLEPELRGACHLPPTLELHRLEQRPELLEDVVDGADELGAVADQPMAPLRQPAVDRPRYGKHLAPLLTGEPGRDQRPGAIGRLHDHRAERQPGDDPIALREGAGMGGSERGGIR